MVAARELGGKEGAFPEEAGAEPVKVGVADLEVLGGISGINKPVIKLLEDLLKKEVGEAFGELLFLIAPSQSTRCPLVEGKLRPLVFMVVQGGLRNPDEGFSAEAMRNSEEGTTAVGLQRQGGPVARSNNRCPRKPDITIRIMRNGSAKVTTANRFITRIGGPMCASKTRRATRPLR